MQKNNWERVPEGLEELKEGSDLAVGRVCIFPCGGMKKVEATVARIASYIVNEDLLPGKTMLMCVPAFLRGVEEDILMVENNPTVLIDCHSESCGSALMHSIGIPPAARVYIPDIVSQTGLISGRNRQVLDPVGNQLAQEVARRVAKAAQWMLENPSYHFEKRKAQVVNQVLCEFSDGMVDSLNYIQIEAGIYRPKSMPPLWD
jgi:hypothetical protein